MRLGAQPYDAYRRVQGLVDINLHGAKDPPIAASSASLRIRLMSTPPRTVGQWKIRAAYSLFARRLLLPHTRFIRVSEIAGGPLLLAALAALVWANSPWPDLYQDLWHTQITLDFAGSPFNTICVIGSMTPCCLYSFCSRDGNQKGVTYVVLPAFALANAGVLLSTETLERTLFSPI